jgi:hypothetical protein
MSPRASTIVALAVAALAAAEWRVQAHSGPPFPIISNQIKGAYDISVWTDPDTTDDGTPGGQFWITLDPSDKGATIPASTEVTVEIRPLDRSGNAVSGRASPVNSAIGRQFLAVTMDHEGRFAVAVTVDGPLGRVQLDSQVDATYDARPSPAVVVLYLLPFIVIGALWAKVLLRRKRRVGDTQS